MLLLAFDTAGPDCAVALARSHAGGAAEILVQRSERIVRGHAERLMPMIEAALGETHLGFADIGVIAVTAGPGSFTGVRVGIAAARALALALDIPALGIGSLEALVFPIAEDHSRGTAVAVLDARRGEVYGYAEDLASGSVLVEAAAMPVADLAVAMRSAAPPLLLTGTGAPLLSATLADGTACILATAEAADITDIARLGFRRSGGAPPAPLYLRGADAKPQAGKALARA